MPSEGNICRLCRTEFTRLASEQGGRRTVGVTLYPVSEGYHLLVRTGERCPECRMDLMGPGPEEQAELAFEAPLVPVLEAMAD